MTRGSQGMISVLFLSLILLSVLAVPDGIIFCRNAMLTSTVSQSIYAFTLLFLRQSQADLKPQQEWQAPVACPTIYVATSRLNSFTVTSFLYVLYF